MKIACFADDPGGANGVIAIASVHSDTRIFSDDSAKKYIRQHGLLISTGSISNEDVLFVGATANPQSQSYKYIKDAKSKNIPSFAYVDAAINAENRFKGVTDKPLFHAPDYLFVNEGVTAQNFIKLGFNKERIFIVGNARYDFIVNRFHNKTRESNNSIDVLFLADPLKPSIGDEFKFSGFGAIGDDDVRSFLVLDELLNMTNKKITIKLHPRNSVKDFLKYGERCEIYDGNELGIDLAFRAACVLGTTTSLLVEAALIGVPSIAVLLTPQERQWLPQVLPDNFTLVSDRKGLRLSLQANEDLDVEPLTGNRHEFINKAPEKMLGIMKEICGF